MIESDTPEATGAAFYKITYIFTEQGRLIMEQHKATRHTRPAVVYLDGQCTKIDIGHDPRMVAGLTELLNYLS